MKANLQRSFRQYLDRQAPILEVGSDGQSRRISDSGWQYASKEIRRYTAIHYYFERGLSLMKSPFHRCWTRFWDPPNLSVVNS